MACASSASSSSVALYRYATTSGKNQRPEPIGDLAPTPWHQVTVNVHRDVDGRVPHERLDTIRVLAIGDEQAGVVWRRS